MTDVIKAKKAAIIVGNIELNVYQMPNGIYILSKTQTCSAINIHVKRLSELLETKALQTHMPSGLRLPGKVSAEGENKPFDPVDLHEAVLIWQTQAFSGNELAQALVIACTIETLERRADAAFEVTVPEPVRDARIVQRLAPKCTISHRKKVRKCLMKIYDMENERDISRPIGSVSKSMTVKMNEAIFGVKHFNCNRFNMTAEQQYAVAIFEADLLQSSLENPRYTIESLVECQVDKFTAAYGDFYHLSRITEHEDDQIDW